MERKREREPPGMREGLEESTEGKREREEEGKGV